MINERHKAPLAQPEEGPSIEPEKKPSTRPRKKSSRRSRYVSLMLDLLALVALSVACTIYTNLVYQFLHPYVQWLHRKQYLQTVVSGFSAAVVLGSQLARFLPFDYFLEGRTEALLGCSELKEIVDDIFGGLLEKLRLRDSTALDLALAFCVVGQLEEKMTSTRNKYVLDEAEENDLSNAENAWRRRKYYHDPETLTLLGRYVVYAAAVYGGPAAKPAAKPALGSISKPLNHLPSSPMVKGPEREKQDEWIAKELQVLLTGDEKVVRRDLGEEKQAGEAETPREKIELGEHVDPAGTGDNNKRGIELGIYVDSEAVADHSDNRLEHFVAIDHATKSVVLALKGTATVADFVRNVQFEYVEPQLRQLERTPAETAGAAFAAWPKHTPGDPKQNAETCATCGAAKQLTCYEVHKGMWDSAVDLVGSTLLTEQLKSGLKDNPGYGLVVTGHSLGAGVAALVTALLARRKAAPAGQNVGATAAGEEATAAAEEGENTATTKEKGVEVFETNETTAPGRKISFYGFAPAASMDRDLAILTQSMMTSVVVGHDLVPSLSGGKLSDLIAVTGSLKSPYVIGDILLTLWNPFATGRRARAHLTALQDGAKPKKRLVPPGKVWHIQDRPFGHSARLIRDAYSAFGSCSVKDTFLDDHSVDGCAARLRGEPGPQLSAVGKILHWWMKFKKWLAMLIVLLPIISYFVRPPFWKLYDYCTRDGGSFGAGVVNLVWNETSVDHFRPM